MHCARKRQRVIEQGRGTPVVAVVLAQPTTRGKDLRPRTTHSAFPSPAAFGITSHMLTPVYNERTSDLFNSGQELGGLQPLSFQPRGAKTWWPSVPGRSTASTGSYETSFPAG